MIIFTKVKSWWKSASRLENPSCKGVLSCPVYADKNGTGVRVGTFSSATYFCNGEVYFDYHFVCCYPNCDGMSLSDSFSSHEKLMRHWNSAHRGRF
jgi:hypothetical protein